MSEILARVQALITKGELIVSRHGFRELAADDILVGGVGAALVVEEYPAYFMGPSVLVLQRDGQDRPIHVVWGIPKDRDSPAVVVTAYRPDPARWSSDFLRRTKP